MIHLSASASAVGWWQLVTKLCRAADHLNYSAAVLSGLSFRTRWRDTVLTPPPGGLYSIELQMIHQFSQPQGGTLLGHSLCWKRFGRLKDTMLSKLPVPYDLCVCVIISHLCTYCACSFTALMLTIPPGGLYSMIWSHEAIKLCGDGIWCLYCALHTVLAYY